MGRPLRNIEIGVPYHIAHRGNQQATLFESDIDRRYYLSMLGSLAKRNRVRIGGFCLMSNHVHFAVVPDCTKGISRCFGQLHKCYSEMLNTRRGRRGCNWEGRVYAGKMDDRHAWNALRYIERNPVAAGLVAHASEWAWSSAGTHCGYEKQWRFLNVDVRREWVDPARWREVLGEPLAEEELETIEWISVEEGLNSRALLAARAVVAGSAA
jgi:putative transposase